MTTQTLPPIDSFRLDLPSGWMKLPLSQREVSERLQEQEATGSWRSLPVLERRRAELYLRRIVADVQANDVRLAAAYVDASPTDDSTREPEPSLTLASCIVSLVRQATIGSELPLTPAVLQAAMSAPPAEGRRSSDLEPPKIVSLPHAQAVLVRRLVEIATDEKEPLKAVSESYFVTVPDEHDQAIVLQFTTPNLADAGLFSELFAAIAGTVRLYRTGEETAL